VNDAVDDASSLDDSLALPPHSAKEVRPRHQTGNRNPASVGPALARPLGRCLDALLRSDLRADPGKFEELTHYRDRAAPKRGVGGTKARRKMPLGQCDTSAPSSASSRSLNLRLLASSTAQSVFFTPLTQPGAKLSSMRHTPLAAATDSGPINPSFEFLGKVTRLTGGRSRSASSKAGPAR